MKRLNLKSLLDTREVHHLYVAKKELLVNFDIFFEEDSYFVKYKH